MKTVDDQTTPPTALAPVPSLGPATRQASQDRSGARRQAGNSRSSEPSKPSTITVILADPGPMFRLGLRALLREYEEFRFQEADDLDTLVALASRAQAPATALIDLDLPPAGGAAAVTSVRDSGAAPVVWCSGTRLTPDVVYELVRAGAVGILRKEIAPRGVVRTLRAAASGEAPLPRDLVTGLLSRIHSLTAPSATRPPITTLSSREREVLALVAEGHSNKTIARQLFISEFTAKRHVQNVLNKLALHRRQDAATRFREEVAGPTSGDLFEAEQL